MTGVFLRDTLSFTSMYCVHALSQNGSINEKSDELLNP
jgi:hypothetical protein